MNDPKLDFDATMAAVLRHAHSGLAPNTTQRNATLSRLSASLVATLPAPLTDSDPITFQRVESQTGELPGNAVAGIPRVAGELQRPGAKALLGSTVGKAAATALFVGLFVGGSVGFGGGYWARSLEAPRHGASRGSDLTDVPLTTSTAAISTLADHEVHHVERTTPATAAALPRVLPEQDLGSRQPVKPADTRASGPLASGTHHQRASRDEHQSVSPTSLTSYDEIAYVRRAQKALNGDNAALALTLMGTLDEQLPRGALLTERNVTRVLALCALGRAEEARRVAVRLRNDKDSSAYAVRLAASCAHLELSERPQ
jgi:hypothetical protein